MEYCDHGDLFQRISQHQKEQSYMKEDDVWRVFLHIV